MQCSPWWHAVEDETPPSSVTSRRGDTHPFSFNSFCISFLLLLFFFFSSPPAPSCAFPRAFEWQRTCAMPSHDCRDHGSKWDTLNHCIFSEASCTWSEHGHTPSLIFMVSLGCAVLGCKTAFACNCTGILPTARGHGSLDGRLTDGNATVVSPRFSLVEKELLSYLAAIQYAICDEVIATCLLAATYYAPCYTMPR